MTDGEYELLDPPIRIGKGDLREFYLPWDALLKVRLLLEPPCVEVVAIKRFLP